MVGDGTTFNIVATALLAVFGALASFLSKKDKEPTKFSTMLTSCFVAAFAGILAHFTSQFLQLDTNLSYVLAGVFGWGGPQMLDALISMVAGKTGLDIQKGEGGAEAPGSKKNKNDADVYVKSHEDANDEDGDQDFTSNGEEFS